MGLMRAIDCAGQAVVITGGTRGIGAGIARAFLQAGAQVLVCGRTEPTGPDTLPAAGGRTALFVRADVRDPDQARLLIRAALDRFGRIDVVVSNAGGSPPADAATASPRFHAKIIELNLIAPLHVAQAANAAMQDQPPGGSIIMIGSVSGTRPSPGTAAYGAAKAGLHHLATSLAVEWAPKVRVNTIVPGMVASESAAAHYGGPTAPDGGPTAQDGGPTAQDGGPTAPDGDPPAQEGYRPAHDEDPAATHYRESAGMAAAARTIPLQRMATPEDIADACLFLASPMASYISGAALTLHGGGERPAFMAAVDGSV
jgi:NAD(P)-dependent dehydrogenase (short-subunit alcohol dehydrogenase family)